MRESMLVALVVVGVLILATNIVATVMVFRSETASGIQRAIQSCVVWLIPLLGALVVILFHRVDRREPGPEGERARLDGSEVDVALGLRHDGHH